MATGLFRMHIENQLKLSSMYSGIKCAAFTYKQTRMYVCIDIYIWIFEDSASDFLLCLYYSYIYVSYFPVL